MFQCFSFGGGQGLPALPQGDADGGVRTAEQRRASLDQEELEASTDLNPWLTAEEKKGFLLILL